MTVNINANQIDCQVQSHVGLPRVRFCGNLYSQKIDGKPDKQLSGFWPLVVHSAIDRNLDRCVNSSDIANVHFNRT